MKHIKYFFKSTASALPLRPGCQDYKSIKSVDPEGYDTYKKPTMQYTGDKLAGIATMHKSNAVPVTKGSEMIKATAKMRRG